MFLYIFTILLPFASANADGIVMQLRPEQILNAFQSAISSDYLRILANEFAKKAAEHLISEMKNQEKQFKLDDRTPVSTLIDKEKVLSLLREPSPDGDNLDAELVLSDEDTRTTTKDSRPNGPMKINGAYYKRFFSKPIV